MDNLNRAIREAEKFLTQAESEEIRELLRRKYYELLKRKYEGSVDPKDTKESSESSEPENLPQNGLPKVVEKLTKLHALRKFKIDEDTIREFYQRYKGRIHEIFVHLAKYLPKYFENNKELRNISKINVMWDFASR
jgi:hypothetical protein